MNMITERCLRWTQLVTGALMVGVACSEPIMVIEYPAKSLTVEGNAREPDASLAKSECEGPVNYWSALVSIDYSRLPQLWDASDTDNVFITARVRLPVAPNETLERVFPLFTIEGNHVESQIGIDLLRKFPLSAFSRSQIAITLEAKFLEDAETMHQVKQIIKTAEEAAAPYLANYPVASQIAGTAVKLTERISEESDAPSSATIAVNPRELEEEPSKRLKAFLLIPLDQLDGDSSDESFSQRRHLTECENLSGRLCVVPAQNEKEKPNEYESARFEDAVYITISFSKYNQVLDDALVVREARGDCSSITEEALARAQSYLIQNRSLFSPRDVDGALAGQLIAREYISLTRAINERDMPALMNLSDASAFSYAPDVEDKIPAVEVTETPKGEPTKPDSFNPSEKLYIKDLCNRGLSAPITATVGALCNCYEQQWQRTPAREIWQAWQLYDIPPATAAKRAGATADAFRLELLAQALRPLAALAGRQERRLSDSDHWLGSKAPILQILEAEARALANSQLDEVKSATCANDVEAKALASRTTVGCPECWSALRKQCAKHVNALDAVPDERGEAVEQCLADLDDCAKSATAGASSNTASAPSVSPSAPSNTAPSAPPASTTP